MFLEALRRGLAHAMVFKAYARALSMDVGCIYSPYFRRTGCCAKSGYSPATCVSAPPERSEIECEDMKSATRVFLWMFKARHGVRLV